MMLDQIQREIRKIELVRITDKRKSIMLLNELHKKIYDCSYNKALDKGDYETCMDDYTFHRCKGVCLGYEETWEYMDELERKYGPETYT